MLDIYIYIYIEREREKENEDERVSPTLVTNKILTHALLLSFDPT
jgi:hypothetical protein